jgi:hypothetical protein
MAARGGNPNDQTANTIAALAGGGVAVAGTTMDSFAFLGGPMLTGMAGVPTAFVQTFDAMGNPLAQATNGAIAGVASSSRDVTALAVDATGDTFVAGSFGGRHRVPRTAP